MKKDQLAEAMKNTMIADLYKSQEELGQPDLGEYTYISISEIDDFPNQPYGLHEDSEDMKQLSESIEKNGILTPVVLRPKGSRYEMISGHRRKFVALQSGIEVLPAIIRELTDAEATILMVDTNIYREDVLPSEKAKAYKMRLEAMKHQGRTTSAPLGQKLYSVEELAQNVGESKTQVQRYIALNSLIPELLEQVDQGNMKLRPAVEISRLTQEEQSNLYETMQSEECSPSLVQAKIMKEESQTGGLSMDRIFSIMTKPKPNQAEKIVIKYDSLKQYFPKSYTPKKIEETIIKLCEQWYKKMQRQHEHER